MKVDRTTWSSLFRKQTTSNQFRRICRQLMFTLLQCEHPFSAKVQTSLIPKAEEPLPCFTTFSAYQQLDRQSSRYVSTFSSMNLRRLTDRHLVERVHAQLPYGSLRSALKYVNASTGASAGLLGAVRSNNSGLIQFRKNSQQSPFLEQRLSW